MKRLAKRRKWSVRETIGTLLAVWDVAYDNKTPIMRRIDVDTAAESDGFADDMVDEDLAESIVEDLISVRLRGVSERIQYLLDQAERGRRGGRARAANAERSDDGRLANVKQSPGHGQADAKQAPDLPTPISTSSAVAVPVADPVAVEQDAREARKRQRGSRIAPSNWMPRPEDALLPADQLGRELAKFRDYQFTTAKSDWDATWRNWQRTAMERSPVTRSARCEPQPPAAYPQGEIEL